MNIWFKKVAVADLLPMRKNTMVEAIGIEFTEIGEDFIKGTMPVDHRTHQPMGLLHGGASVALAETLGSVAANLVIDPKKFRAVGLEINANHLKSIRSGLVEGTARPIHLGKGTQVWEIKITGPSNELICISRLTVALLEIKQ